MSQNLAILYELRCPNRQLCFVSGTNAIVPPWPVSGTNKECRTSAARVAPEQPGVPTRDKAQCSCQYPKTDDAHSSFQQPSTVVSTAQELEVSATSHANTDIRSQCLGSDRDKTTKPARWEQQSCCSSFQELGPAPSSTLLGLNKGASGRAQTRSHRRFPVTSITESRADRGLRLQRICQTASVERMKFF